MGKAMLLLAVTLAGIGLLMTFSGVFDAFVQIDTDLITPLTITTSGYVASDNSTVSDFNKFDHIIMHNLAYLFYGGAVICLVIGLGQMRSAE